MSARNDRRSSMAHDEGGFPGTVAEAANKVLSGLSEEDKEVLREAPRDRLHELHFGLGSFVRNSRGLWGGNDEMMEACARARHPEEDGLPYLSVHTDEASAVIVEEVWRRLNA